MLWSLHISTFGIRLLSCLCNEKEYSSIFLSFKIYYFRLFIFYICVSKNYSIALFYVAHRELIQIYYQYCFLLTLLPNLIAEKRRSMWYINKRISVNRKMITGFIILFLQKQCSSIFVMIAGIIQENFSKEFSVFIYSHQKQNVY